jgi:DNA-binding PadR family transcriptional regulator
MRETTYLILTALADRSLHGYAIIGEVKSISQQRVTLRAGSLYGALDRLVAEGLIRKERQEVVGGRLRCYYELSESGRTALAAEARHLAARSSEALRRLTIANQPA